MDELAPESRNIMYAYSCSHKNKPILRRSHAYIISNTAPYIIINNNGVCGECDLDAELPRSVVVLVQHRWLQQRFPDGELLVVTVDGQV